MTRSPVQFGIVGIGGFAAAHHESLRREEALGNACVEAVAEIAPERYPEQVAALRERGVRLYNDARALFEQERGRIDVVTLPVGIAAHAPLAVAALEAGFDVLVEKPPAATVQDVDAMIAASARTGRFCAVGFQYLSSPLIRQLKSLLVAGRIGELREIACRAHWPRGDAYYSRNPWAGRCRANGHWVLDGPLNNALSHHLMNMLFLAGPTLDATAVPLRVRAELYHVRDIEGEDTSTLLAELPGGGRVFFGVTHACRERVGPVLRIVGTRGTVTGPLDGSLVVTPADGAPIVLDTPDAAARHPGFANVIDHYRGACPTLHAPVTLTRALTATVNAAYESSRRIHALPPQHVHEHALTVKGSSDRGFWVDGLDAALETGWREMRTFSDMNLPWAVRTDWFALDGYREFRGAALPH